MGSPLATATHSAPQQSAILTSTYHCFPPIPLLPSTQTSTRPPHGGDHAAANVTTTNGDLLRSVVVRPALK